MPATLWLPAMVELCGNQPPESFTEDYHYLADIYNGEGKEYQLFRELKVSPYTTNETLVRQWKGKDTCWWERTASPDTSESEGTLYMTAWDTTATSLRTQRLRKSQTSEPA